MALGRLATPRLGPFRVRARVSVRRRGHRIVPLGCAGSAAFQRDNRGLRMKSLLDDDRRPVRNLIRGQAVERSFLEHQNELVAGLKHGGAVIGTALPRNGSVTLAELGRRRNIAVALLAGHRQIAGPDLERVGDVPGAGLCLDGGIADAGLMNQAAVSPDLPLKGCIGRTDLEDGRFVRQTRETSQTQEQGREKNRTHGLRTLL
jgi:hypothetical protein